MAQDRPGQAEWLNIAEVFLSLDAEEDGRTFFEERLKKGDESARLSSALALSQLLLVERKYVDYADLATTRRGFSTNTVAVSVADVDSVAPSSCTSPEAVTTLVV